jgi:DNA mismatch endonuclease (patch repair protein)
MDKFNASKRSEIMRSVKSKNNKSTEIKLINFFKTNNITEWRRNYNVIGKPDFVFLKKRIAIFVDGCFWHGHNCRNLTPKQNSEYWLKKQQRNIQRDMQINNRLSMRGWSVVKIWFLF